jgi:hypothetical protein
MPVGFYVPGTFAAATAAAIERGFTRRAVIKNVLALQRFMFITCCDTQQPCAVFTKEEIGELHDLAVQAPYADFLAEVERRYATKTVNCRICGREGHLPTCV